MLAFHTHLSAASPVSNLLPITPFPQLVKYLSGCPGLWGNQVPPSLKPFSFWVVLVVMMVVVGGGGRRPWSCRLERELA